MFSENIQDKLGDAFSI